MTDAQFGFLDTLSSSVEMAKVDLHLLGELQVGSERGEVALEPQPDVLRPDLTSPAARRVDERQLLKKRAKEHLEAKGVRLFDRDGEPGGRGCLEVDAARCASRAACSR